MKISGREGGVGLTDIRKEKRRGPANDVRDLLPRGKRNRGRKPVVTLPLTTPERDSRALAGRAWPLSRASREARARG
ncbi:MAG: hypothetical protein DHS20C15_10500 [Planctomycetota bacterium]|nr:MAG: hypothetical protein DHS20C15_10500 [Planctomycetota bacterium]